MKGLVTEAFIVAITLVSSVIIISTISPIIHESQQRQSFTEAKQTIQTIDTVINQLMFEAPGAKRSVDLNLPSGRLIFSGTEDKIKIRLDATDTNILQQGTSLEEQGITIQGGGVLNAYDNGTDYILENSAVLFAMKKIGSQNNLSFTNTSSIITLMRNKRLGVDVIPRTGIFINDTDASSYGYGFTELSATNNLQSGSIRLYMNTATANYDALFTLTASADFVEMQVKNIIPK